jgi:predicted N-acyltransferase
VGQSVWDILAAGHGPFCQFSFLHALEISQSVGADTGWQPSHLVIYQQSEPVGVLPLYKKTHSYGEYVFDFAWANTYRQYGVNYYPKLVSAIPFTPVTGKRLMLKQGIEESALLPILTQEIDSRLQQMGLSSMHWLYVDKAMSTALAKNNQLARSSVQFQWFNRQFTSFEHYLEHFNSRKRKSVRKERSKIFESGVEIQRKHGNNLSEQDMLFFYHCYQQTYLKRSGHEGYLKQAFFLKILADMPDNIMLVIASKNNQPLAGALFIYDHKQLCGRYWGALEDIDNLHFECCYYQGIEFCIEQNIAEFNPGTQGEHKILRGFEPTYCYSNHSLKEPAFHDAVGRFIKQENSSLAKYKSDAEKLLPFKKAST